MVGFIHDFNFTNAKSIEMKYEVWHGIDMHYQICHVDTNRT